MERSKPRSRPRFVDIHDVDGVFQLVAALQASMREAQVWRSCEGALLYKAWNALRHRREGAAYKPQ